VLLHALGRELERRRANRLVTVLRVFLRLEDVWFVRNELGAEACRDVNARLVDGVGRHADRVGAHVGDEADGAAIFAEVDPFVQMLRDLHRSLGAEAETVDGVLLELAGRVRAGACLLRSVFAIFATRNVAPFQSLRRSAACSALVTVYFLPSFCVRRARNGCALPPPFCFAGVSATPQFQYSRDERFDFALAVDDETEGHRLNAAGREAEGELRPHQRGDVVADDAIEDAACALRVVERLVQLARVGDPVLDPFFVIS